MSEPNFLPRRSRRMGPAPRTEGAWMSAPKPNSADPLVAAGLPHDEVSAWLQQTPGGTTDFATDRVRFSDFWQTSKRLTGRLPPKPSRSEREQLAAGLVERRARDARFRFLCPPRAPRHV